MIHIIAALMALLGLIGSAKAEIITGTPRIVDGDTIVIDRQRIRIFGIDAPESAQICTTKDHTPYACGQTATSVMRQIIGSWPVSCDRQDTDRYGRMVAICMAGQVDIGASMVASGWAVEYRQYSHGRYRFEEDSVRTDRRGIWTGQFEMPWDWRMERR